MALPLVKPTKAVEDYHLNDHIVRGLEERLNAAELRPGAFHLVMNLKKVLKSFITSYSPTARVNCW